MVSLLDLFQNIMITTQKSPLLAPPAQNMTFGHGELEELTGVFFLLIHNSFEKGGG